MSGLTQNKLKKFLKYDAMTGHFTWLIDRPKGIKAGDRAGFLCKYRSRIVISIKSKAYQGHVLAFLYMKGYIPKIIDHKNCDPSDNRWSNLRKASPSQNCYNRKLASNSTSGFKGITFDKDANKWKVSVRKNYVDYFGGQYLDKNKAVRVAIKLRNKLHGEYARIA